MSDRIKLAEAIGWKHDQSRENLWRAPWLDPNSKWVSPVDLPDPFTDANDDYAVLEWMRLQSSDYTNGDGMFYETSLDFMHELDKCNPSDYQIGDYAKAALKILDGNAKGQEHSDG